MIRTWTGPAWIRCPACDGWLCRIHGGHAASCPCPVIDEWGDVDHYGEDRMGIETRQRLERYHVLICSRCGKSGPVGNTVAQVYDRAEKTGWRWDRDAIEEHLCPDCTRKAKPWPGQAGGAG